MEPLLLVDLSVEAAGHGCKILLGDVNGDGQMELICVQPNGGIDDRYEPHEIVCVTVMTLDGSILWQKGSVTDQPGKFGSDFPAQVVDIDGDGALEVICVMADHYYVLNGLTGQVKQCHPCPGPDIHDCIIVANLTGQETPRDVILKDRYEQIYAMDQGFNLLWTYKGNVGHFPWAEDINGDGYDEVMAGYTMLNHKGQVLWSCEDALEDHADCIWVGDVNHDGALEVVVGGSVTCCYTHEGQLLWSHEDSVESQHIALGRFRQDLPGLQVAGLDRIRRGDGYKDQWDGMDGLYLIDAQGETLWKENRKTKGWLTIIETFQNWNGSGLDHILAYRRGGGVMPTLYDGYMKPVVTFPLDGYVIMADVFGRGVTDAVIYQDCQVHIYSASPYDVRQHKKGVPLPQTQRLYRATLYPGGTYRPLHV